KTLERSTLIRYENEAMNYSGGRMVGCAGTNLTVIVVLALMMMAPRYVWAQQSRGVGWVEELLKSIGLSKPATTRAPDFNLRDSNGGAASLAGYRGNLAVLNFWAAWGGPVRGR